MVQRKDLADPFETRHRRCRPFPLDIISTMLRSIGKESGWKWNWNAEGSGGRATRNWVSATGTGKHRGQDIYSSGIWACAGKIPSAVCRICVHRRKLLLQSLSVGGNSSFSRKDAAIERIFLSGCIKLRGNPLTIDEIATTAIQLSHLRLLS